MAESAPRNRRERRAAAKQSSTAIEPPTSAPKVKLARPDYSKPKGKTLMDIYEERKAVLNQGQPFDSKHEDGLPRDEGGNILYAGLSDGEPIGPVEDAIIWTICLSMLHFTLDVLVYNQYAQSIAWPAIFKRTFTILPILFLTLYMLRSKTAKRFSLARQFLFLGISVAAGCYTIHVGNRYEYFAVMKQAPPLGTVWIWSVIELNLPFAVASVAIDVGYLWWNGYVAF